MYIYMRKFLYTRTHAHTYTCVYVTCITSVAGIYASKGAEGYAYTQIYMFMRMRLHVLLLLLGTTCCVYKDK